MKQTHSVHQGSPEWLALRTTYFTASEAPAMMGVSKYTSRSGLLRQKATGIAEDVDSAKQALFDKGHQAEADARPLAEAIVEADLYPVTESIEVEGLELLASLDGLSMAEDVAWETKLWNEALAADVRAGALSAHYTVQMDQELLVSGASRCLFTCTDGTPERLVSCWYESSREKLAALIAGWHQFANDLAAYAPPAAADPVPVGKAPETLPALRIEVTGMVTASNLAEFKETALAAIRGVNRDLSTDADFADAAKAVKWCGDVESRLAAAKEHALSQTASIDALFKAIDDISAEARLVRLDLDKLVTRRKVEVKESAVTAVRKALDAHVAGLNAEIAPMRLLPMQADFSGAIKGKRTVASMQDALETELAAAKIATDAAAKAIRANLKVFTETTAGVEFLFADLSQIVHKPADDFAMLLRVRIDAHKAAEAENERARQAEADRLAAVVKVAAPVAVVPVSVSSVVSFQRPVSAAAPNEPATLKLGAICERLGFVVTAAFLSETLGIQHTATDKAAKLYRESDWRRICTALTLHITRVSEPQAA